MKRFLLLFCVIAMLAGCNHPARYYVQPMVGTDEHGHTFPGAILPFGAVQVSPDTRLEGWDGCSGYHYSDDTIFGFSHTHLSGTGCSDYGDILLMPFSQDPMKGGKLDRNDYKSHFKHRHEVAQAGYYRVILDSPKIQVELTAAPYCGYHRYQYADYKDNGFIIDLRHRDVLVDGGISELQPMPGHPEKMIVTGWRRSAAWNPNQRIYFALTTDSPIDRIVLSDDKTQAALYLKPDSREITVSVALSAVDEKGAINNLRRFGGKSFDKAKDQAFAAWDKALGTIEVKTPNRNLKRNFYTALYHCMTSPYLYSDPDGRYRGVDDTIHRVQKGRSVYTVFSLWDTYRAEHPLLTLIDRQRTLDFVYSFLQHYRQGGELTMWELAAHETHCMIGYHSAPVILDAMRQGILDSLTEEERYELLEALKATANLPMLGRPEYARDGYLSSEWENESVSKTLEYAYDDWCIAQYAMLAGDSATYGEYMGRCRSYRNLMDDKGFMHAKRNGAFVTPFDPTEINNHYTEANCWQYSTYVPHDVDNWVRLMGGEEAAMKFLDTLFESQTHLSGRDQADVTGLIGQYAHGNEPSHHAAYLYTYLGQAWKTQQLVNQICTELYQPNPAGLCGNEDCGQMSAWYVMSALGFYPVCPGSGQYVIGRPMFKKATIHLENGKDIVITCKNQKLKNPYIQHSQVGRRDANEAFVRLEDLLQGCEMHFEMGSQPNKDWGKADPLRPHSDNQIKASTPAPYFNNWEQRFKGSERVSISIPGNDKNTTIYYTLDGSTPTTESARYTGPFTVSGDMVVKAVAYNSETGYSPVVRHVLTLFVADKQLSYLTKPDPQYYENGEEGLIDKLYGSSNYRIGGWQGWRQDLKVVVDLMESKDIHRVGVDCLENMRSWIFFPPSVTVEVSDDGTTYRPFGSVENEDFPATLDRQEESNTHTFVVEGGDMARYVRITAKNYGALPQWHTSAGETSWLFADEVTVE